MIIDKRYFKHLHLEVKETRKLVRFSNLFDDDKEKIFSAAL